MQYQKTRNNYGYKNNYNNKRSDRPKEEGLMVFVQNNDVEKAIRRLKKKVNNAGILQEFRDRKQFIPNTLKRRTAEAAGKARWKKKQKSDPFYQSTGPRKGKKR